MAEIKAEPKAMDELDYLLLELNNSDDKRIQIIKLQIKSKISNLENEIKNYKNRIQIIKNILFKHVECEWIFDDIFDEYLKIKANQFSEVNENETI